VVAFAGGLRTPFFRYWLSGFLADFGDGVRLAAFPLLAAQLTRSPSAVAAVTAVQGLPWLLLGGGLGVIVDRTDRRRLIVIVDITRALIIAALAAAVLTHSAGLAVIYLTAFATGTGSALRDTAAATCVPRLVQPADLDQANARVIAGQIVGSELAGPAAGGWLLGLAAVLPFAVNAGTLGIAVLLLLTLPGVFGPLSSPHESPGSRAPLASMRHDLAEGLRWLRQHPATRDVTILAGVLSALDGAWFAVLVLYVVQILHQQPGSYGLLLARRRARRDHRRRHRHVPDPAARPLAVTGRCRAGHGSHPGRARSQQQHRHRGGDALRQQRSMGPVQHDSRHHAPAPGPGRAPGPDHQPVRHHHPRRRSARRHHGRPACRRRQNPRSHAGRRRTDHRRNGSTRMAAPAQPSTRAGRLSRAGT
jgi:hypothetical protein